MKKHLIILSIVFFSTLTKAQMIEQIPDSLMKTKVIKVEFFSPLTGNLTFGYEKYIKNFTSIEAKIGIIGIGANDPYEDSKGVFVKIGPKFKLKPDYAVKGTFGTHFLRGSYIRPEVAFTVFSAKVPEYDYYNYSYSEKDVNVFSGALLINYGKQHVLGDIMTLDYYVGLGYGFSDKSIDGGYYFGYLAGNSDFPIAINAGFTLGIILK